jgi:hypothetical protein
LCELELTDGNGEACEVGNNGNGTRRAENRRALAARSALLSS